MNKFYCLLFLSCFGLVLGQNVSEFIVVDQFGYQENSQKIAVLRNPKIGFDAAKSFVAGSNYAIVNKDNSNQVYTAAPTVWNTGQTDASSGDKVWWFDFSSVQTPGTYYVLDITNNLKSYDFEIRNDMYDEVLKHAVRTFFYQRSGYEKKAQYAGTEWADGASHIGALQDKQCRSYKDRNNPTTELDLHGGWYDAGDFNKYSSWTADYVIELLTAYQQNPTVWADDYNIPESGNGVPDILDEAKWGIDHLKRLQLSNGSVISVVSADGGTPPSSAMGQSLYGDVNTSSTLSVGAAYAKSALVFLSLGDQFYADELEQQAIKAWDWAVTNPNVIWKNNDASYNSKGVGAGQQETNDYGRLMTKLKLANFLFELTGDVKYRDFFDQNYKQAHLMAWNFAYPFEAEEQETLLYYISLQSATISVKNDIISTYKNAMNNGAENYTAYNNQKDPYLAHIKDYTWASNNIKMRQGLMYQNMIIYQVDPSNDNKAKNASEGYIHYLHGVNPNSKCYLSNMKSYGAENSVSSFYHTWFHDGSALWDEVGVSTYGPAPGFVVGGANPKYNVDACCPNSCGSAANNAKCNEDVSRVVGQPDQKSYMDFNTSWPINSWEVTENSCSYQSSYIRLLAKFISSSYDCSGTKNGTAFFDVCNKCSGGNTGRTPETNPNNCQLVNDVNEVVGDDAFIIHPNPSSTTIEVDGLDSQSNWKIINMSGQLVMSGVGNNIDINKLISGMYYLKSGEQTLKFIKK